MKDASPQPINNQARARLAVVLGTLLAVLDLGMINISLPTFARSFDVAESQAVWVSTVYQLVSAATLLIASAVSYLFGRRWVYAVGLGLFVLGSLGAALAPSLTVLIGFRMLMGLGAAAMLALGPALLKAVYPAHQLGRALALNALVVAFGLGCGPTLGGLVLWLGDWTWIFLLNLPLGLVALILALQSVPRDKPQPVIFDAPGAVYSVLMIGGLMLAFERFSHGASAVWGLSLLTLASISAALFVTRQRRAPRPLLPLDIFDNPRFSYAILVTLFAFIAQGLAFVALSFLYQTTLGYSALTAALLFSPWPITLLFSGPISGRLSDRFNPALLSTWGLVVFVLGIVLLAWGGAQESLAWLVSASVVCGLGYGFFQAPNNHEVMANASGPRSASASGVLASVRTLGQSLGSASFALIVSMSGGNIAVTLWTGFGLAVLALGISVRRVWVAGQMAGRLD
ncbi:MFS transporter [Saccharospirillum salsuginis]|uniref:MFS transporter n=1 Tax=Saccharospirillum salsuginis TaxID=418750 RepID=A0A918N909_9GAMM|nr:MFS transporter [Saccharospirillum salsuginis]GGX49001.1 MFS transporter [Saccharospirillum salsuginis]